MNYTEKTPSEQESLDIILKMVDSTRSGLKENSIFFLLWGYGVLAGGIIEIILLEMNNPKHPMAWLILFPIALAAIFLGRKKSKQSNVNTHLQEFVNALWMALGISFAVVSFLIGKHGPEAIYPVLIVLYGIGTFVTGKSIQFKPLMLGGISCWIIALIAGFSPIEYQLPLLCLSLITSYIIPGHLLQKSNH